ncbi:hypothetical protein D7Z26_02705 [Cohnella endophytica]|uniref:non-specific serine/threonine protein kinase n=2 Tax=Cohnella endophytica TaxID=2419778 RepID=A0A494Y2E0_9BACL|nr:hypothetical protein D7Z26_02705 [Cohnella endophytica]
MVEHGRNKVDRHAGMDLEEGNLYGGRYRIVMPIGKGGMGRVYLAEDIRLGGKPRALKLTRPMPDDRRAFLPEAKLLSELDHPNLPAIVDYFPPDNPEGIACIVMDYIAGDTLEERFERYGRRLSFSFVLGVLCELCKVLVYLHAQRPSIVFRDLKPSNVLMNRRNESILVDFGIARRYREEGIKDTLQLGTPGFAAPEQLRGEQSDSRTDLYGLGALAYYLLSGGRFAIRHSGRLRQALQNDVPLEFLRLLERLLDNDPNRRPQSAQRLEDELMEIRAMKASDDRELLANSDFLNVRDNEEKTSVIAIASVYPGAGATTVTLALSSALSRRGISHALVECPGSDGELFSLLDGSRKKPRGTVYARPSGDQAAEPAWRNGKAALYPLDPNEAASSRIPEPSFANWLKRLGVPLVLLDVSSRWEQPELAEWLVGAADRVALVADCFPAKWSRRRQEACIELQRKAMDRSIKCDWIANRDQPFPERRTWQTLFPSKPIVCFPDIEQAAMLRALWRGEGFPADSLTAKTCELTLSEWVGLLTSQPASLRR